MSLRRLQTRFGTAADRRATSGSSVDDGCHESLRPTRDTDARVQEFTRSFERSAWGIAVGVLAASLALGPRYGALFVGFTTVPLGSCLLNRALTGVVDARRRSICSSFLSMVAVAGAAIFSGGLSSPVIVLIPVVGLPAVALFPDDRRWFLLSPATMVLIGAVDAVRGVDLGGAVPSLVAALVACVAMPRFALDVVAFELSYRRRAVIDPLTGCLNRTSLEARCAEIEEQHALTGAPVAAVTFDIDHFKSVNDRFGHAGGDAVLVDIAYRARKELRHFELLYRLGGEEFALLLPGLGLDEAVDVANRLHRAIESADFEVGTVTISCGVAADDRDVDITNLLERADDALYSAKRHGRNQVRTFDPAA